ncbi:MAG: L-histidine N(alpha)-methyltransferase [Verrucomicrobiota bacterium]|nr:L-histidine N(alpha)-methyltransferase [Verrucomicrobiota bacterium]
MGSIFTPFFIHEGASGDSSCGSLLADLGTRRISPAHLYNSPVLSSLWHRVHLAHSPLRQSPKKGSCEYSRFAQSMLPLVSGKKVTVTSLGCGDGYKDALFLKTWQKAASSISYQPVDISAHLVKKACDSCSKLSRVQIMPGVCGNLADQQFIQDISHLQKDKSLKIGFYFGINPNFQQVDFFNLLKKSFLHFDHVVFSANLAPGDDYEKGVRKIFTQYDNPETRDWFLEFLGSLGIRAQKKALEFSIRKFLRPLPHYAICVNYIFPEKTALSLYGQRVSFKKGESLDIFHSFRHTLQTLKGFSLLSQLTITREQVSPDQQEALLSVQKKSA